MHAIEMGRGQAFAFMTMVDLCLRHGVEKFRFRDKEYSLEEAAGVCLVLRMVVGIEYRGNWENN